MKMNAFRQLALGVVVGVALTPVAQAQPYGTAADSTNIRATVADLDSAWSHADAARWAAHYSPDADFINILGMVMEGADAIRARQREIFDGVFKGSRRVSALKRVRFLQSTVAVADVDIAITEFKALPPGSQPTEPGILRARMRHVLTKTGDKWLIVATQNTAVAPAP